MTNKKLYLGIALAMTLASCNNDELANNINESTLKATVESSFASRVGFDKADSWSFFWHSGDKIWVNKSPMSTQDADKSKTATFKGYGVNTNSGYAVYPYDMAEDNVSGTTLTWNFPSTYTYTDIDEDFFESAQDIPMYARVENGSAAFKHLGAIAVFKLNDWEFTGEHVFTLTASKKITGEFTTDLASSPMFETTTESEDVVTINYTRPEDATAKVIVFYVPIPTGTYDIQARVKVAGETILNREYTNVNVECGDIVWAEYGESTLTGGDGANKTVSNVSDIDEDVLSTSEENLTVKITEEVTGTNNTIEIPSSLQSETTTFTFASIAQNATISIEAEDEVYAGQIIIEVPQGVTANQIIAEIPNGEVYIKQGNVETLVASSKNNTTYIGAGVTVTTLEVVKGNVRIENGGTVTSINRSTEPVNSDEVTYVIYEGTVPTTLNADPKIKYVSAAEWDLRKAIETGNDFALSEDITVAGNRMILPAGKTMTLDLNGKTITWNTSDSYGIQNEGTLTIKNGTISFTGGHQAGAAVRNKNVITMENVSITANAKCFFNNGTGDAPLAQLGTDPTIVATITGGTFESTPGHYSEGYHIYAIETEFYSKMTLSDAEVEGDGGVCVDVSYATLTNVTATHTCTTGAHDFYVACGNATVSGCTFANAAAFSDDKYGKAVVNGTTYGNGTTGIAEELVLANAFANGGTLTLTDNIELNCNRLILPAGKTLELDLNNKTITWNTSDSYGIQNEGTLTIKNGTINFTGGHPAGAAVRNKAVINMNNVSITANAKCFFNNGTGDAPLAQLGTDPTIVATITGGTFESTPGHYSEGYHIYAIETEFYSKMTLSDAEVEGDGGVCVDVSYATLSNVTATHTCTTGAHDLYIAAGNATVSGCTFANAAAYSDATYGNAVVNNQTYQHDTNNANGTTVAINLGSN